MPLCRWTFSILRTEREKGQVLMCPKSGDRQVHMALNFHEYIHDFYLLAFLFLLAIMEITRGQSREEKQVKTDTFIVFSVKNSISGCQERMCVREKQKGRI